MATMTATTTMDRTETVRSIVLVGQETKDADLEYWWTTTGEPFRQMLEFAGYSLERTMGYLDFYKRLILPAMGPSPSTSPNTFKGCLTTDGTPIEYSLSFTESAENPEVRFSIDPDATSARGSGTELALDLASKLSTARECSDANLSWGYELFDHFNLPTLSDASMNTLYSRVGHKSQVMYGFDFSRKRAAVNAKAYFLPDLMAAYTGQTRWSVTREAIRRLATTSAPTIKSSLLPQLQKLDDHLWHYSKRVEEGVRYLSVDLVDADAARIKTYLRNPGTTFEEVWDFFTLRGQIPYGEDKKRAIEDLYACVRGQDADVLSEEASPPRRPSLTLTGCSDEYIKTTSAFKKSNICYFVLKNGYEVPRSKLFIRVQQPFARSDLTVARGLEGWFRRWQWLQPETQWSYARLLRDSFPHRDLDGDGLHCWIGVSIKNEKLTIESYLTPELYKGME